MQLIPHLQFKGNCEEAFKFYEQCLKGKIQTLMTFGDSPMADQVPSDWGAKVIHATLIVGKAELMGSDPPPDHYQQPQGMVVTIQLDDIAEAERVFRELSEGGTVTMPIQQTYWAARFAMFVDRFGIPWMINCGQPA